MDTPSNHPKYQVRYKVCINYAKLKLKSAVCVVHSLWRFELCGCKALFSTAYRQYYSPYGLVTSGHFYGHHAQVFYGGFITG